MVFVTDGAPNRNNAGSSNSTAVLNSARAAANTVKSNPDAHLRCRGGGCHRELEHSVDGDLVPAAGWRFDTTLTGAHTWTAPAEGTEGHATDGTASLTTGVQEPTDPGLARFESTCS